MVGAPIAQKAAVPTPQDKLAIGEDEAKQLLLLIDTDKKGKVSKQEWMKFMEAEFERLDKAKTGYEGCYAWMVGSIRFERMTFRV